MNHYELEKIVNQQLNTAAFSDYAPNGLQVEGRARQTAQRVAGRIGKATVQRQRRAREDRPRIDDIAAPLLR